VMEIINHVLLVKTLIILVQVHVINARLIVYYVKVMLNVINVLMATIYKIMGDANNYQQIVYKSTLIILMIMLLYVKNVNMDIKFCLVVVIHVVKIYLM
jgi:hypothetical protein